MAVLQLINGGDVTVQLSVSDVIAALQVTAGTDGFVEMPTDGGPIHVRPASVVAVIPDGDRRTTGFRTGPAQR